ncbi:MAG: metallophosphoesterase [Chitinispirillaceae bacterium]
MARPSKKFILIIFPILVSLMGIYSFVEPYWMEEKTYVISDSDIPVSFEGMTVVFLTDIHHGPYFSRSRIRTLVDRVNRLEPDIVLLGGDYVEGHPKYIEPCFEELSRLRAAYGVYGVLGNHDHWQGAQASREAMARAKIKSIDNAAFWVDKGDERIKIGGVGDHCEDVQHLEPTVSDVSADDFTVLVTHSPDYIEEMENNKVDLAFAGHTHGGQVTFFGLFAIKLVTDYGEKYRTGLVSTRGVKTIVSNGIGMTNLPIRFFARPQIVIAVLKSE